MTTYTG